MYGKYITSFFLLLSTPFWSEPFKFSRESNYSSGNYFGNPKILSKRKDTYLVVLLEFDSFRIELAETYKSLRFVWLPNKNIIAVNSKLMPNSSIDFHYYGNLRWARMESIWKESEFGLDKLCYLIIRRTFPLEKKIKALDTIHTYKKIHPTISENW